MRFIVLAALAACAGSSGTPTGDSALSGACALAAISQSCPSCSDGPHTCAYGEVTVSRGSCGECQVRSALYDALCEAGETDSADQIEAGAECAPFTCAVRYECSCTPQCLPSNTPEVDCASTCPTPEPPPSECGWTGLTCDWLG